MKADDFNVLMFDAAYPPPVTGGKEKQAHLLSLALHDRGIGVRALSYRHSGNRTGYHDGIHVDRVPRDTFALIRLFFLLARLRWRFQVLHIHTPSRIGRYLAVLGRLCGFKVVFKFPSVQMLESLSRFEEFSWRLVLLACGTLVVLAKQAADELDARSVPSDKIFHVPNGVEVPVAAHPRSESAFARLLFVGRLVELKRCADILEACASLPKALPWHLTMAGDGPERAALVALAEELKITDHVDFVGHVYRPLELMKEADILILASSREGMPNVVLEAMSTGLAVVSTPVGAVPDMLGEAGADYTFPIGDVATLSRRVERLIVSPWERRRYGAALHLRCKDRYSIDSVAKIYIQRYRSILG